MKQYQIKNYAKNADKKPVGNVLFTFDADMPRSMKTAFYNYCEYPETQQTIENKVSVLLSDLRFSHTFYSAEVISSGDINAVIVDYALDSSKNITIDTKNTNKFLYSVSTCLDEPDIERSIISYLLLKKIPQCPLEISIGKLKFKTYGISDNYNLTSLDKTDDSYFRRLDFTLHNPENDSISYKVTMLLKASVEFLHNTDKENSYNIHLSFELMTPGLSKKDTKTIMDLFQKQEIKFM